MRSSGLRVLVAVIVLAILALWLWHPGSSTRTLDRASAVDSASPARIDLSPPVSARESAEPAAPAASKSELSFDEEDEQHFDFDLTVTAIDPSGRPLQSAEVRMGIDLHALAMVGRAEGIGDLHFKWRGSEPSVDVVLEARRGDDGCSTLRHIHLTAGTATSIRLAVDKTSIPVLGDLEMLHGAFRGRASASNLDDGVEFKSGEGGTGVFVDANLMRAPLHLNDSASRAFAEGLARASIERYMIATVIQPVPFEIAKDPCQVDITALDELGAPIPMAMFSVLHRNGGGGGGSTRGHLRLGCASGLVRVIAGGAQHAVVWQDVELEDGETRVLRMVCPTLERTRLRLLDGDQHPLAGWHLESRSTDVARETVDRADTDNQGRAEIVIEPAGRTELLVRPPGPSTMPKMRVATGALDRNADNDIVLDSNSLPGQLVATILTPDPTIEARLWNIDTDEGTRLPVLDESTDQGAVPGRKVRADSLVPGTYVLEIGGRCAEWKRIGPFRIAGGQLFDAGTWALDPPATLTVTGIPPKSYLEVTARSRVHGLWLVGKANVSNDDPTQSLTPGEWTITIRTPDGTTPQRTFGPRVIRAESGQAMTRDFREANDPR
jgi:hypothetical protein